MNDSVPLFNDGLAETASPTITAPLMMTPSQRSEIRGLFAELEISTAPEQFEVVKELTGHTLSSVGELTAAAAQMLTARLKTRLARRGRTSTGNSWDDREEDTWIDRL